MRSLLLLMLFCATTLLAGANSVNEDSLYLVNNYTKAEYRIPMRDGATLFTVVYSPKDQSSTYPILFNRTPYNVAPYGKNLDIPFKRGLSSAFLKEKYIFVYQDVRGRFMSEGTFQHMTPFIENKTQNTQVDESSDAYDAIDWLIKNVKNNNGKVGMWGISYPGFYATCAAINAHPALKCVSPQAPIADWYFDDVHHQGTFFLAFNLDFFAVMDLPRHGLTTEWPHSYNWGSPDGYSVYLRLGSLANVNRKCFGDSIKFWNDIVEHPNYDEFWQKRNIIPHIKNIKPAVLLVGGWYDAEDLYGTFNTHKTMVNNSPNGNISVVIGPWYHGGWARSDGSSLGNVSFGDKTSFYYRDSLELPFFNFYLKNEGNPKIARATMFETGKNQWRKFAQWPPKQVDEKELFLHENGVLSFEQVGNNETAFDEYISDPAKPIPFTEEVTFGMARNYMTDDQRFAAHRPDVLVYQTDVLTQDITLAGPLKALLNVSTSGTDADWVIKLIDVYPTDAPQNPTTAKTMKMGEYQQMVRSEILRGRYRKSFEHPVPFEAEKIEPIEVKLQDVLHCFQKGHRIMVQIQSTWFPLADRNPQHYVDNIYQAKETDFIKTTNRVYHQSAVPSKIKVSILKE